MYRLRTVDVWDTLLRRRCHPDAVKLHTAGFLLRRHWSQVLPALRSGRLLLHCRLDVERELARSSAVDPGRDDEYALRDVLALWLERSTSNLSETPQLLAQLCDEELEQESRVSYADPTILDFLAGIPAEKTLFLSDFYMSADQLRELLSRKGLSEWVDEGCSSCDAGLNKRSGRLFEKIMQDMGISPGHYAHIGDNPVSDVRVPAKLGIAAMHYKNPAEQRLLRQRASWFRDRRKLFADIQVIARRAQPEQKSQLALEAFDYGISLAPLFAGFGLFLLESAQRDQLGKLYFFSREGVFFSAIYRKLVATLGEFSHLAPPAIDLQVSRLATFCPSLRSCTMSEMSRLWSGFDSQSPRAWGLSLGLNLDVLRQICDRLQITFDASISAAASSSEFDRLLHDQQCRALVELQIRQKRELLQDYLRQSGLSEGSGRIGVVDIGWHGSIQDNIAHLYPNTQFQGYYLGLQRWHQPMPSNCLKRAYGPDLNLSEQYGSLFANLPLMEMLCNCAHGSVTGYERGSDAAVQATVSHLPGEAEVHEHLVSHVQRGVLHAMDTWASTIGEQALSSEELRETALKTWQRVLDRTPSWLRKAHAQMLHDEQFGRGTVGPPPTLRRKGRWRRLLSLR